MHFRDSPTPTRGASVPAGPFASAVPRLVFAFQDGAQPLGSHAKFVGDRHALVEDPA